MFGFLNQHFKNHQDLSKTHSLSSQLNSECSHLERHIANLFSKLSIASSEWTSNSAHARILLRPDGFGCMGCEKGGNLDVAELHLLAKEVARIETIRLYAVEFLVIDEAAQLKECESLIPLQLFGLRHVLIGDECQLPTMVKSKVSLDAMFGRSLFERLSSLGHKTHLLDIQYRMHPSISIFPNGKIYDKRIADALNVLQKTHEVRYLSGPMYGPYSFINIEYGEESCDDIGYSWKNVVEVAVILQILRSLYSGMFP